MWHEVKWIDFVGARGAAPGPRLHPVSPGIRPCVGVSRAWGGGGFIPQESLQTVLKIPSCVWKGLVLEVPFLLSHLFLGIGVGLAAALD